MLLNMEVLARKQLLQFRLRVFNGYITLISVLVIGAVGVAIVVSIIWLGSTSTRFSLANEHSAQAWALANACVEEALQQIHDSVGPTYTGTGDIFLGRGKCHYSVEAGFPTQQDWSNFGIIASGTVGTVVRKVHVSLKTEDRVPNIPVIGFWQEVAD